MIKVGDTIKSLDFAGDTKNYMVGIVTIIEGDFITCDTVKIVRGDSVKVAPDVDRWFKTAKEGCYFTDAHYPGRITVL